MHRGRGFDEFHLAVVLAVVVVLGVFANEVPPEHLAISKFHASGLAQCSILEQFTIQPELAMICVLLPSFVSVERLLDIAQSAYEPCTMIC